MNIHKNESAFTLLEIVVVVGLIAVLAVSLSNAIIGQFKVWESNTNLIQIHDTNQLITDYLEKDAEQAISFTDDDGILKFDLDVDHDGIKDREVTYKYYSEKDELKRFINKPAESITLDGEDDYIAVDKMKYQSTDNAELSILAQVKSNADTGIIYSFDRSEYFRLGVGASGYYRGGDIEYPAGKLTFEFYDGNQIHDLMWQKNDTLLNDGEIHNIAAVFDNGTVRLYLDGKEEKIKSSTAGNIDSTFGSGTERYGFLGVGSEAQQFNSSLGPHEYFSGDIYWLQHWDRALSKQEVGDVFAGSTVDQTDLALHYDFSGFGGENIVSDLADDNRGDNQGQVFGDNNTVESTSLVSNKVTEFDFTISDDNQEVEIIWTLKSGPENKDINRTLFADNDLYTNLRDKLLRFDGSSSDQDGADYVAVKKKFYQDRNYSELTLMAKVKTTDNQGIIYSFDRSEYFRFAIGSAGGSSGHLTFHLNTKDVIHNLNGKTDINDGKEHILAVVFDNGQLDMYIDGELDKSFNLGENYNTFGSGERRYGFMGTGSEATEVDGQQGPTQYFSGDLYWLQHWNKALTEQQIKYYSDPSLLKGSEEGLISYYEYPDADDNIFYDSANSNDGMIYGAEVVDE